MRWRDQSVQEVLAIRFDSAYVARGKEAVKVVVESLDILFRNKNHILMDWLLGRVFVGAGNVYSFVSLSKLPIW